MLKRAEHAEALSVDPGCDLRTVAPPPLAALPAGP